MFGSSILKYALIPLLMLGSSIIYKKWPNLKQDNIVEEFIEEQLEAQVGIDIDLSPDSKED